MSDRLIYAVTFPFRFEWPAIIWWTSVLLIIAYYAAKRVIHRD
jgi:hypothetical protein